MKRAGDHRANRHFIYALGIEAFFAQNRQEKHPQFVNGAERRGAFAKLGPQGVAIENAGVNLGVTDVEAEEHGKD
jgi:hypothetical protein